MYDLSNLVEVFDHRFEVFHAAQLITEMAPSKRKTRRGHLGKKAAKSKVTQGERVEELSCLANMRKRSSTRTELAPVDERDRDVSCADGCSTPRGWRHTIPEIMTCPPAPKKPRISLRCSSGQSASFFSSPELEVFFSALGGISA